MSQLNLIPQKDMKAFKAWTHGGVSLKKRRKVKRPLVPRAVTHVVFKSSKAKRGAQFLQTQTACRFVVKTEIKKVFCRAFGLCEHG